jgi:hypothetical protein
MAVAAKIVVMMVVNFMVVEKLFGLVWSGLVADAGARVGGLEIDTGEQRRADAEEGETAGEDGLYL